MLLLVCQGVGVGSTHEHRGDVAVAGEPPPEGWAIGIAVDSAAGPDDVDQVVAISHGGLASSSTAVRTWQMGSARCASHRGPGDRVQRQSALAPRVGGRRKFVDANAVSTAAVVWGDQALERLRPFGHAVRLLRHDGEVFVLGGWPESKQS